MEEGPVRLFKKCYRLRTRITRWVWSLNVHVARTKCNYWIRNLQYLKNPETQSFYYAFRTWPTVFRLHVGRSSMASEPDGYMKPVPYRRKCTSLMIATRFPVGFNVCLIFIMSGQFNSTISTNLSWTLIVLSEYCTIVWRCLNIRAIVRQCQTSTAPLQTWLNVIMRPLWHLPNGTYMHY